MKTNTIMKAVVMSMVLGASMSSSVFATEVPVSSEHTIEAAASTKYFVNVDKYETVKANTTDVYNKVFAKGESVVIYVSGDGDTDLDLYVYDENGNLIDSDTDSLDDCVCTFTPKWTGRFTIKVKNLGKVYNRYHLRIVQ